MEPKYVQLVNPQMENTIPISKDATWSGGDFSVDSLWGEFPKKS